MDYYFYNTDASTEGVRGRYPILIKQGLAVTGGPPRFGELLGNLELGDVLLMYENMVGIVAVGRVQERWDEQTYTEFLYYPSDTYFSEGFDHEYRIKVKWDLDLSSNPISVQDLRNRLGFNPRGTRKRIVSARAEVEKILKERGWNLTDPPSVAPPIISPPQQKNDVPEGEPNRPPAPPSPPSVHPPENGRQPSPPPVEKKVQEPPPVAPPLPTNQDSAWRRKLARWLLRHVGQVIITVIIAVITAIVLTWLGLKQ